MTRGATALALLALAACGGAPSTPADSSAELRAGIPAELPVLTVGEPLLQIGEFEGGGDQTLDMVTDVRPLDDGTLALVDQGAMHVRIFTEAGELVRTIGGEGDGPGEFRRPGVLLVRNDSLWVSDERDRTVSRFTMEGEFADQVAGPEFSGDERFPLNTVFHGRMWLDRVMDPQVRSSALRVSTELEYPLQRPGFRMARATAEGGLWVLEHLPTEDEDEPSLWMRVGPDASLDAFVELPARFDPMWMEGDEVWGVWMDEFEVNYLRRYLLVPTERSLPTPTWVAERTTIQPPTGEERDSALMLLKQASKNAAVMQEFWYADNFTYTLDLPAALAARDFAFPEGVEVQMLSGHSRGHKSIATFAGLDAICGVAYGNEFFSGVMPGAIICGNEDEPTWWDKDSKAAWGEGAKSKGR